MTLTVNYCQHCTKPTSASPQGAAHAIGFKRECACTQPPTDSTVVRVEGEWSKRHL